MPLPPFIDRQDLTDLFGRDVTADAGALIAVDAACQACRTVAEQSFNAGTSTITLDGPGTDALLLPERPVVAAGTVLVSGGTVSDYALKDNGVLVRKVADPASLDWWSEYTPTKVVWPAGRQNVQVTYEHGYSEVPTDVRMVALAVASRLVVQGPALQETAGENSVRYAVANTDFTNGEKAILHKYRGR